MATKSQQFRADEERKGQHAAKATAHTHEARLTHNDAHRVDPKASYALEENGGGGRPSRKSTRGSSNRAKPDSALRITARIRNASPEARATRKSGNPT
jgi:hypothetical protein